MTKKFLYVLETRLWEIVISRPVIANHSDRWCPHRPLTIGLVGDAKNRRTAIRPHPYDPDPERGIRKNVPMGFIPVET